MAVSDRVKRLVCTSVEYCKSSLPFESSRKVLNQALKEAEKRGKKTMVRNIEARIRKLNREGGLMQVIGKANLGKSKVAERMRRGEGKK